MLLENSPGLLTFIVWEMCLEGVFGPLGPIPAPDGNVWKLAAVTPAALGLLFPLFSSRMPKRWNVA